VNLSHGAIEDFLHDAVAMLFFPSKGEQNVEPLGFEGQEALRLHLGHDEYLY
jgi:hypothetical protein